jgi:hypothetical protein
VDQQSDTIEQTPEEQPAEAVAPKPVLSTNEVLFVFLASMILGFAGVLIGFVPLVALAMLGPIIVAFLA